MNSELSQNMGRKRGAKNQIAASTSEEIHHIETIILNPEEGAAGDDVGPPHEANKVQQNISPLVSDRANFQRELQVAVDEAVQGAMQEVMQSVNNTVRDTVKDMRTAIENQISTEQIPQEQNDGTWRKSRLRELPSRRRRQDISSDSDDELDHHHSQSPGSHSAHTSSLCQEPRRKYTKIPPFNGKESWKTWYNQFSEIADRRQWSDEDRLDELLPKLQGDAGEFAFGELPKTVRTSYQTLVAELESRFRKVETSKSFELQFSNRSQKQSESPEAYASELKRLYTKAYPKRQAETRKQDLIRKFLNGLYDDQARFHIEYVKDPSDIDEAVFEVVNFTEIQRRKINSRTEEKSHKCSRMLKTDSDCIQDTEEEIMTTAQINDEVYVARMPGPVTAVKSGKMNENSPKNISEDSQASQKIEKMIGDIAKSLENLQGKINKMENARDFKSGNSDRKNFKTGNADSRGSKPGNEDPRNFRMGNSYHRNFNMENAGQRNSGFDGSRNQTRQSVVCFKCREQGHYAAECDKSGYAHLN